MAQRGGGFFCGTLGGVVLLWRIGIVDVSLDVVYLVVVVVWRGVVYCGVVWCCTPWSGVPYDPDSAVATCIE